MVLLPETGRLEEMPLPRLLLDLHRAGFGGAIQLRHDRLEKTIQFHQGIPVFAESNLPSETLATSLLQSGTITEDAFARVVERTERDGCKEERAVLDLELLPPRDVFEALKKQVRCRLLDCFGWSHGTFQVDPGDAPPDGVQAFRADLLQLLQEGIETRWSSERILTELGPRMVHYATPAASIDDVIPQIQSDAAVRAVLAAADGSQTLWQLLELATTPRALATVWLLDAVGAFEYAADSAGGPDSGRPNATEIEIEFETAPVVESDGKPGKTAARAAPSEGAAAKRLREDITARLSALEGLDYYALLGVDSRADAETIKRAYLAAAKDYHPDTLARRGIAADVRAQASRVFARIGKAYATLSRPNLRREYDARLAGDDLGAGAEQIATAETLYRKGEILLRQGNFRGALEFLLPAVEIYPDEADYQNAAGWALYRQSPPDPERARSHLEKAAALATQDAVVHFRLGVVLRSLGDAEAAEVSFSRARQLDPTVG